MSTNAIDIREAMFARVQTLPGYTKYRRIMTPQLQPDDLPCISVVILSETMVPEGDHNAGEPSFISDTTIGLSVTRGFKDPIVLDGQVDDDIVDIETKLLQDPTFVQFGDDALFEGVTQITRKRTYPFDGETYFLELRLEMTFRSRIDFPPLLESPFKGVSMETAPFGAGKYTPIIQTDIPVSQE